MPSLSEQQQRFADAVQGVPGGAVSWVAGDAQVALARIAIYRATLRANYRNALSATYPVVKRLVGTPFFHAAADAFTAAHPSVSGDLNIYGDSFGAFLGGYPPAAALPYLPDVARLEWAIDEANRANDAARVPDAVLAALAITPPARLPQLRLTLNPSCRLVASMFPILRIWQTNQPEFAGDARISLDRGGDAVLIRRDPRGIALEWLAAGEHGWLAALAAGATLGAAIDAGQAAESTFDLGATLRAHIAACTIVAVVDA